MTAAVAAEPAFPSRDALLDPLATVFAGRAVTGLERTPFSYATSFPLHRVTVHLDDGERLELIVKDLRWSSLLGDAPSTKPGWLHRPSREIGVYRHLLDPLGVRPCLIAAGTGSPPDGEWLAMELVAGQPLWEIGDVEIWEDAARWLARFHDVAARHRPRAARLVPDLVDYSEPWMNHWLDRARHSLDDSNDPRSSAARSVLDEIDRLFAPNDLQPGEPSLIHGELYPSNVLVELPAPASVGAEGVGAGSTRICPIDWELAGIGNRFLDLAALITGWPADTADRLIDAYLSAAPGPAVADDAVARQITCCRVVHAVRWIGWSPGWSPPDDHAHDWIDELLVQAEQLDN